MAQLDCPRCNTTLNRTPLGCLCSDCDGVWFGFDQFDQALRLSALDLETSDIEPTLEFDKPGVSLEHHVACPACGKRMKRHTYMVDSGVVVDMCRDHGMWLDDGELSTIREYLCETDANLPESGPQSQRRGFFQRIFGGLS